MGQFDLEGSAVGAKCRSTSNYDLPEIQIHAMLEMFSITGIMIYRMLRLMQILMQE